MCRGCCFILSSLFPIFFVAYHVYRYKLVDVAVKDSLVYAMFALVFIAVYTYGVRRLDQFLVDRFEITPGVVEVILILGMVALAEPVGAGDRSNGSPPIHKRDRPVSRCRATGVIGC